MCAVPFDKKTMARRRVTEDDPHDLARIPSEVVLLRCAVGDADVIDALSIIASLQSHRARLAAGTPCHSHAGSHFRTLGRLSGQRPEKPTRRINYPVDGPSAVCVNLGPMTRTVEQRPSKKLIYNSGAILPDRPTIGAMSTCRHNRYLYARALSNDVWLRNAQGDLFVDWVHPFRRVPSCIQMSPQYRDFVQKDAMRRFSLQELSSNSKVKDNKGFGAISAGLDDRLIRTRSDVRIVSGPFPLRPQVIMTCGIFVCRSRLRDASS